MNKLINPRIPRIQLCLIAAMGAAILLANPATSLAQAAQAQRRPGPTRPTPPPQNGELKSIQARASAAATKLDFKDPKSVKQVNAELARVNADLVAYAKGHGLKLTTTTYTNPVGTSAVQACPAPKPDCYLSKAYTDDGVLYCFYTCLVEVPPQKK